MSTSYYELHTEHGLLSSEQERLLIARIQRNPDDQKAQERLITANLGLITRLASKYVRPGVELEDLQQEGCIALLKAAQQFDLSTNYKLSTYATWKIRQEMRRYIDDYGQLIRVPAYQHEHHRRKRPGADNAQTTSETQNGARQHKDRSRDSHCRFQEEVRRAFQQPLSLEQSMTGPMAHDDELLLKDTLIDDEEDTEAQALSSIQRQEILAVLNLVLTPQQSRVIQMLFGLHESQYDYAYTLQEIGTQEHKSKEWCRLVSNKALQELRHSPLAQRVLLGERAVRCTDAGEETRTETHPSPQRSLQKKRRGPRR